MKVADRSTKASATRILKRFQHAGELLELGCQHGLRAGPDQEEHRFPHQSRGGMTGEKTRSFGRRQIRLRHAEHQRIGPAANGLGGEIGGSGIALKGGDEIVLQPLPFRSERAVNVPQVRAFLGLSS